MDSNDVSGYVLNHGRHLPSGYYQRNTDGNIIDLGLSLRVIKPDIIVSTSADDEYGLLMDWHQLHPQLLKSPKVECSVNIGEICEDERDEGIQSKRNWKYVKVNMKGVIVGRKLCLLNNVGYSSLGLQLEDMFGKFSMSGLGLFHESSEFSLYYKDLNGRWRLVGDTPWNEFEDCVDRLWITQKDQSHLSSSSPMPPTFHFAYDNNA
ncbi:hypothetical protein LIER_29121 [Lithospermum erythrorhizon]|uniref:Auxin-responsive protein n=1 Tax=Lithospermum erythrorhizon TaxID=34254 RepID=A0AAV3RLD7_LITER